MFTAGDYQFAEFDTQVNFSNSDVVVTHHIATTDGQVIDLKITLPHNPKASLAEIRQQSIREAINRLSVLVQSRPSQD